MTVNSRTVSNPDGLGKFKDVYQARLQKCRAVESSICHWHIMDAALIVEAWPKTHRKMLKELLTVLTLNTTQSTRGSPTHGLNT